MLCVLLQCICTGLHMFCACACSCLCVCVWGINFIVGIYVYRLVLLWWIKSLLGCHLTKIKTYETNNLFQWFNCMPLSSFSFCAHQLPIPTIKAQGHAKQLLADTGFSITSKHGGLIAGHEWWACKVKMWKCTPSFSACTGRRLPLNPCRQQKRKIIILQRPN